MSSQPRHEIGRYSASKETGVPRFEADRRIQLLAQRNQAPARLHAVGDVRKTGVYAGVRCGKLLAQRRKSGQTRHAPYYHRFPGPRRLYCPGFFFAVVSAGMDMCAWRCRKKGPCELVQRRNVFAASTSRPDSEGCCRLVDVKASNSDRQGN